MAEVLTTKLKNDTLRLFKNDILNQEFFFTVSSIATGSTPIPAVNSQYSKNEFKENLLFGKRVFESDIKYMIKYYPWQKDTVYTQYDDTTNLEGTNFYSVVGPTNNDSGDYRVYKCLNNNNGAPSTVPPNYNAETVRQIYSMPDGYVWKFMYYLTEQEFEAYNAVGFVPITGVFEEDPTYERFDAVANTNVAITGSEVSSIFVENYIDNNGYTQTVEIGVIGGPPGNDSTLVLRSEFLSEIQNYYSGMTIYVTIFGTQISKAYVIDTYEWDPAADRGRIKVIGNPVSDGIIINSTFRIVPTVVVEGDGTGCVAVPNVIDGVIKTIEIIEAGQDYNNITAYVVDPNYDFDPDASTSVDIRAILRPVLSPKGSHNFNIIDELHCRHVLLYSYITETDNNQIGRSNTYSAVGLMKNPVFTADPETANTASPPIFDNRLEIITNDYGKVTVDSIVKQVDINNKTTFEARVHAVRASSNSIYLCSYMGPYTNVANNDISLDPTRDLINETGQKLKINSPTANNIFESRYTQRSGEMYFMEDFIPLERTNTSREEYKLVLEI